VSIRTQINMHRAAIYGRGPRRRTRIALATPEADLTYEQARMLRRYWGALAFLNRSDRNAARQADRADERVKRMEAERQLHAHAYGNSVDAIKNDALAQGAALFGPGAELEITGVENIATSHGGNGAFHAVVTVRMVPGGPATEKAA
jgi:hypothetical protein